METLFLYLDEELVNHRPGRIFQTKYDENQLAFWTQFYSLFYDKLYVPVNFLTDSNQIPIILKLLGIEDPQSAIRAEKGPFRVLWDQSRFPTDSISALVEEMLIDPVDVSMRQEQYARETVRLLEKYLGRDQIVRADMTVHLDPKESFEQLEKEVFNPEKNTALPERETIQLNECLQQIQKRGEYSNYKYGRNFFYLIFGPEWIKTKKQEEIASQFSDIVEQYMPLRRQFLTAVDYVSHRLKAKFASESPQIGHPIGVLIPKEYNQAVSPKEKSMLFQPISDIVVDRQAFYQVDQMAVIKMTGQQIGSLHDSDEYKRYKKALDDFNQNRHIVESVQMEKRGKELEQAFEGYLNRVSKTLKPLKYCGGKIIKIALEYIPRSIGIAARMVIVEQSEEMGVPPSVSTVGTEGLSEGIELISSQLSDRVLEKYHHPAIIQDNTIQLTENIQVYLKRS